MKRSTRNLLKAALICFIIGAALGISGFCTGFRVSDFETAVENGYFTFAGPVGDRVEELVTDVTRSARSYNGTFSDVEKLKLDVGVADCRIIPYDGTVWKVTGDNLPAGFTCRQSGSKLKIDSSVSWKLFSPGHTQAKLEIYIPESQEVEKIEIDTGVGDFEATDGFLKCREIEITSGVGNCTVWADVTGKLKFDGGVGDVELILKGKMKDFNFDISCGLGKLEIGGNSYSGFGHEEKIDNKASKDIDLDTGVGEATISFEK